MQRTTITRRIKTRALELGFNLVGVAPAQTIPDVDAYRHWINQNFHGEMSYLSRPDAVAKRTDPGRVLPGVRSVVVVGVSYFVRDLPPEIRTDPARGLIARYAWGRDYHDVLTPLLRQLADFVQIETGSEVRWKVYVDTGPVLERSFAVQAGLGFIGRNAMLISPDWASYLFLGEILLDVELDYDEPDRRGTCGRCTRCLTACPTKAFVAPYVLDSRRCISYLTIELKGFIPHEMRPRMGNWIFGCDVCQEVCPWVRKFSRSVSEPVFQPDPDPDRIAPKLLSLINLDEIAFRQQFHGTPVQRARRRGLLRNVAVALGNWGDPVAVPALTQALSDPEPLVRGHAAWALGRIGLAVQQT
ncbi:MAG: tRNA epoxyqueuosine(34) reductase QueG [Chloroflexi bacterium RBG_16_57_9]|nr:MAG: tRNA epoxyqueuosine(34) reductase QueG [Chloroflexi bacterium RBG_16_57_9]